MQLRSSFSMPRLSPGRTVERTLCLHPFALFTNPPLAVAASLSFQYWRIGNVIGGSFLLVINSMTLYSIWNMIYNLISE